MPKKSKGTTIGQSHKIVAFDISSIISNWWANENAASKAAFKGALIIGFISHLFIYTGRYYGRDDMGMIFHVLPSAKLGRWFNTIMNNLNYGYVLPLVYGAMVTFFLAIAAFYTCKLFHVQKKLSAVMIAGLLSTFPSIANTNLFLYDTPNYHFAVMLAVIGVYITFKYKYGILAGSVLMTIVLAIYQAKFNIALALCLFYFITQLLNEHNGFIEIRNIMAKAVSMVSISAFVYTSSMSVLFFFFKFFFNLDLSLKNYRGMSADGIISRLLSISGFINSLKETYINFYKGFMGNTYLIVTELRILYISAGMMCILFLVITVVKKKLYKQHARLGLLIISFLLVPFACNFSDFVDSGNTYGLMIYAFVFVLVFSVIMYERCDTIYPIIKSAFVICTFLVIFNYIVSNNVYYLKAYYFNQRTESLTTRILARIDPLIPLSDSTQITFFGGLPNEYYPESSFVFREYGAINDGSALGNTSFINYGTPNNFSLYQFSNNIDNLHGVRLTALSWGDQRDDLAQEVLLRNMPVWPAEGSVDLINDIIVVNLGIVDVIVEEEKEGKFLRARHYISEGHAGHEYEYHWTIYQNGIKTDDFITDCDRLYMDMPNVGDSFMVAVTIINTTEGFSYPETFINVIP